MKKLFVYLLLCLLAVVGIAHFYSEVAVMDAETLAQRSVLAMSALASEHNIPLPSNGPVSWLLGWFLKPGAWLLSRFGVDPAWKVSLGISAFIGWWGWLTVFRVTFFTLNRQCGFVSISTFHWWLRLSPPWRPFCRVFLRLQRWWKQFRFGKVATAQFAGLLAVLLLCYRPGDSVYLGRAWVKGIGLLQPVGVEGPRHVTVIASSGAGKTRWLIAHLGMLKPFASAFVIDVDGQIVNSLGWALKARGHAVYNLDPYKITRFPSASWNALEEITRAAKRHGREAAVRFAQTLAEALIQNDNKHQRVFSDGARAYIHGLILYVWLFEPEELRNLVRVRELLTRGLTELVLDPRQDAFELLLSAMERAKDYDDGVGGKIVDVIARAASGLRAGKTREGNPFRSTAMIQTAWLDYPEIARISMRSDFAAEDLKTSNACVFVCVPVSDMQTKLAGWVRALTMMGLYAFENMPGRLKVPCTFAIDEAPSLRIESLGTAAPVYRKYGVRLIIISQDIEKLKEAYPTCWEGFLGNAQCTLWMSTDHQGTCEYLSRVLGKTMYEVVIGGDGTPKRTERLERDLMSPDQVREFLDPDRKQFIVTRTGKPPLRVVYEGYDKALGVRSYCADPQFGEPLARRLTRAVLGARH